MARSSFFSSMNFGAPSNLDLSQWNDHVGGEQSGSTLYDWLVAEDAFANTSTGHDHDGTDSAAVLMGTTNQMVTQTGVVTKGTVTRPSSIAHIHGWNGATTNQLVAVAASTASRGSLTIPARGDHRHAVTYGTTNQLVTQTGVATKGAAAKPADIAHIHGWNGATTNQLVAVAASTASRGSLTIPARGDHRHAVTYGTTNQLVTQTGVATKGAAAKPADIAHIHGWNGATTNQLAAVAAATATRGTLTIGARGDHVHAITYGTTNQLATQTGVATKGAAAKPADIAHIHPYPDVERYINWNRETLIGANGQRIIGGATTLGSWRPDHTVLITGWRVAANIGTTIVETALLADVNVFHGAFTVLDTGKALTTFSPAVIAGYATTLLETDNVMIQRRYGAPGTASQRKVLPAGPGLRGVFPSATTAKNLTITMIYQDSV